MSEIVIILVCTGICGADSLCGAAAVQLLMMAHGDGRDAPDLAGPGNLAQEPVRVHHVRFNLRPFVLGQRSLAKRQQSDFLVVQKRAARAVDIEELDPCDAQKTIEAAVRKDARLVRSLDRRERLIEGDQFVAEPDV
jgi:hypothetical protein